MTNSIIKLLIKCVIPVRRIKLLSQNQQYFSLYHLAFAGFVVLFVATFVNLFLNIQNFYFYNNHTIDSAGFADLLNSIVETGQMKSSIFSSFYSLHPILTMTLQDFESYDFASQYSDANFFRWHAYVISYVLSLPVLMGFSAVTVSIFFNLLGMFGVISIAIYFCYRNTVPVFLSFVFVLALAQLLPVKDAIYGQFYFEKLFPFFMLILCLTSNKLLETSQRNTFLITVFLLLVIFCASISERSALMCGMFLIVFGAGYRFGEFKLKNRWILLSAGAACLAWFVVYHSLFYESIYSTTLGYANIKYNLTRLIEGGLFQKRTIVLLSILLPHFLLGMLSPLAGVVYIFAVLPNVILDVAGAEKVGFYTHYHTMYLPFLVFSNLLALKQIKLQGFINRSRLFHFLKIRKAHSLLLGAVVSVFLINASSSIDYANAEVRYDISSISDNFKPYLISHRESPKNFIGSRLIKEFEGYDGLHVSASNFLMPFLVNANVEKVDAFPVSLYDADFVLIERTEIELDSVKIMLPIVPSYFVEEMLEKRLWIQAQLNNSFELINTELLYDGREINLYKKAI